MQTINRAEIDDTLTSFLFDPQRGEELARTLTLTQWQECLEYATAHKILPRVAQFYKQYCTIPLPENYQAILHTHELERRSWFEALQINAPFSITGDAMLMKGFGHEILYPEKMERFAKDLDVVIADFSTFCSMSKRLLNNGFSLPFMIRLTWHKRLNSWQGLARFIHQDGNEDGGIELHIGQFAVDDNYGLDWTTLRTHAMSKKIEDIPLSVPDRLLMLKIFFMELATRPECMLRDLYDGYCLCLSITDPDDLDMLAKSLNDAGLGHQVIKLVSAFARYQQPPPSELTLLAGKISSQPIPPSPGWRNRLRKALDRACNASDLTLRFLSVLDRPWATRLAMHFTFPIYGIQLNTHSYPLHLFKHRHYLMLATPTGIFLLGILGIFSEEETDYLESVVESLLLHLPPISEATLDG